MSLDQMTPANGPRIERDFLGAVEIPPDRLYGPQTRRAMENSAVGNAKLTDRPALLRALADVKAACALANGELGALPSAMVAALTQAADEVVAGELDEHFPMETVHGGGGTALNMNINEVLANRATQILGGTGIGPVHPNDHVNRSQSTNDVYPTAMCLAVLFEAPTVDTALKRVTGALTDLAVASGTLVRVARSCLQDAVTAPAANLHRTHAAAVEHAREDLAHAVGRLRWIPLGGTAVGTGLGAPPGYREAALRRLKDRTGLDLHPADDLGEGLAFLEAFGAVSDALTRAGRVLNRVAADLRLLASGPIGGFGEITLPPLQAGSSIMPGKINPVLPELVMQVCCQLAGSSHTVALAASTPELDVNPLGPVVIDEVLRSLGLLSRVANLFVDRCLTGVRWNEDRVIANRAGSFNEAVQRVLVDGYEVAARERYRPAASASGGASASG